MTHWYETSFGYEYLKLYAHRDEAEAHADIESIVNLVSPPRDRPLLDLCCGAGRHLASLSALGFTDLVGLDLSSELLHVAQKSLDDDVNKIELVRADMRTIPFRNTFETILSLFTSFGYFDQDRENQVVFDSSFSALCPGGTFVIDYLNKEYVIDHLVEHDYKTLPDRSIEHIRCLTQGCHRVEKTTIVRTHTGQERVFEESVRLYSCDEMQTMLSAAGFTIVSSCGSLDGECFESSSPRLVLIGEKPQG